jgi:hypothetical protein
MTTSKEVAKVTTTVMKLFTVNVTQRLLPIIQITAKALHRQLRFFPSFRSVFHPRYLESSASGVTRGREDR